MGNATTEWLLEDSIHVYLTVATAACLVYDHCTTLADEIELVWKRPGHILVKFLFLISIMIVIIGADDPLYRILSYLVLVPLFAMQGTYTVQTIPYTAGADGLITPGIMMCRISSMHHHNHKIITLLAASFALEIGSVVVMKIITDRITVPVPDPAPGIHFCMKTSEAQWLYVISVPSVSFELLLLVMSLLRGVHYYRSQIRTSWTFHGRNSLANILFLDSITFPFITLAILLVYLVALMRSHVGRFLLTLWALLMVYLAFICQVALGQLTFVISVFWPSIAGPRLILNLREAYYQPFEQECNIVYDDVDLGDLSFK
ncbi:hypothetical protein CVT25_004054 [Psilocybe cyanescens]|uniref:DUF6533 domain-containing protein n=1 Tax=Psilocybe cyanescens TaxID=93625 RepID=A0A409WXR7_PSICY|nr:hypothetical protein CVT25_004054 [Psilocybe cyanescens]